jgi:hypothetical protein
MTIPSLKVAGIAAAILAFALPSAALARGGGGGGGGGGGVTPPAGPTCATVEPLNSGVIDKFASRKPITLDFKVTNCGSGSVTLATSLVGTSTTLRSSDPLVIYSCTGAPFSAARLTLKPRESRTLSVTPQYPFCGEDPWGISGYNVTYDVTTSNAADGAVLATTQSGVNRTGGV